MHTTDQLSPQNPAYAAKVRDSFSRQKFMNLIGARLITTEPGFCEIHVPFHESITQQHGYFHGGIVGTVADVAAGYAAFSLIGQDSTLLTVEFKINLLSPATGELLIAKSSVLKNGKTLIICRSDVFIVENGHEKLCAAAQLTMMELKERKDN